jgi:predicted  nucleic acid-binding Zn-ribbon protein
MKCYCVKCKQHTESNSEQLIQSNNRQRIKSKCNQCGCNKSMFVSKDQKADGLLDLAKAAYKNRDVISSGLKASRELSRAYYND